jgi:hypothetical protein
MSETAFASGTVLYIPGHHVPQSTLDTECTHDEGFDHALVQSCKATAVADCNAAAGCHVPCVDDPGFAPADTTKTCTWYAQNKCRPSNFNSEGHLKIDVGAYFGLTTYGSPEKKCCACDKDFKHTDFTAQEVAPSTTPGTCTHKEEFKDVRVIIDLCKAGTKQDCTVQDALGRDQKCQWIAYTAETQPAADPILLRSDKSCARVGTQATGAACTADNDC